MLVQGDVKKLTDDVAALQPSLFVAVPRVLERIQSGITTKLQQKSWLVRFLVKIAFNYKLWAINRGRPVEKVSCTCSSLMRSRANLNLHIKGATSDSYRNHE